MARDPYHLPSKTTYSNQQNAKRASTKEPRATGATEQLENGRWIYRLDCLSNRAELEQDGLAEMRHLSDTDRQLLVDRDGWKVTNGTITLTCPQTPDPTDRRFVFNGPSGTHSLLVSATDAFRLNAHWLGFRDDTRNGGQGWLEPTWVRQAAMKAASEQTAA